MATGTTNSRPKSWKTRLLNWLGLTDEITIKVYHGYGHVNHLVIYGHVLRFGPLPRRRFSQNIFRNTWGLLRLFMVKPLAGAQVRTRWQGKTIEAKTGTDGFFKLEWKDIPPLEVGWHEMQVEMFRDDGRVVAVGNGSLYIPHDTQFGFISDIDDTFLISHSANLRKRLYVLFRHNARSRKPFEGVVKHYQLLAKGNTSPDEPNPFFFVSSSEWNLYDYLLEFTTTNGLPRGVFLLNILKQFRKLVKTGQSHHHTKFARIVRILEGYPDQRFVLLGDSSQQDPYIYQAIVKHFPKQIHAVYIRDVHRRNKQKVAEVINAIEGAGVPCCFFQHSKDAIEHSHRISLITETELMPTTHPGMPANSK
jgi:phosphatidate phosphatase APP1